MDERTTSRIVEDINEFEMVLASTDIDTACARIGRHPRTVLRWYRAAGREPVAGLSMATKRAYRKSAAAGEVLS